MLFSLLSVLDLVLPGNLRDKIRAALELPPEHCEPTIINEMKQWNSSGADPNSRQGGQSPIECIEQRLLSGTDEDILRAVATLRWCVRNRGRREIFGDGADEVATLLRIATGEPIRVRKYFSFNLVITLTSFQ